MTGTTTYTLRLRYILINLTLSYHKNFQI